MTTDRMINRAIKRTWALVSRCEKAGISRDKAMRRRRRLELACKKRRKKQHGKNKGVFRSPQYAEALA